MCLGDCCYSSLLQISIFIILFIYRQSCWEPYYTIRDGNHEPVLRMKGPCCIVSGPCCIWDQDFLVRYCSVLGRKNVNVVCLMSCCVNVLY